MYKVVELKSAERYSKKFTIDRNKVEKAVETVLEILKKNAEKFGDNMVLPPKEWDKYYTYKASSDVTWTTSMWTGVYWLAYQLTGEEFYRNIAESHLKHYIEKAKDPKKLGDHDSGFKYIPSCVAAYKLTGNEDAKNAALKAAEALLDHCCPVNRFIVRIGKGLPEEPYDWYRMLVDSMMNVELLFWAYEQTGDRKYYEFAQTHCKLSAKYLIREDGSSYHHFQFDPKTKEPVKGVTLQGNRDESCWSRGHSWLIYGYPTVYKYMKDDEIFEIMSAVSNYFLNNLPDDYITYWDFDFSTGSIEPRDTSASAVSACGFLEMCKYLPDGSKEKIWYENAANRIIDALIEKAANRDMEKDCLIGGVVEARSLNISICTCTTYGDYFYLEALARILKPDCECFW